MSRHDPTPVRYISPMTTLDVIESRLGVSMEQIRDFCRRWNVVEFALFGSIVRDDFRPDSDVDVMVRFGPEGMTPRPWGMIDMKLELEELFRREVDVVERGTIRNPFVRAAVGKDFTVLYAA